MHAPVRCGAWAAFGISVLLPALGGALGCRRGGDGGLLVESVEPGAAARAGLRNGDLLQRWHRPATKGRAAAAGRLVTPFDLLEVESEQSPLGPVTLAGRRGSQSLELTLTAGDWRMACFPPDARLLQRHAEAAALLDATPPGPAVQHWRALAAELAGAREADRAWLLMQAGKRLAAARRADESHEMFAAARASAAALRPLAEAAVLEAQAQAYTAQGTYPRAAECLRAAVDLRQRAAPASLGLSAAKYSLGQVAGVYQRDLATQDRWQREALALAEQVAPGSRAVAHALNGVGSVAFERGDLEAAGALWERARTTAERLDPHDPMRARIVSNLGLVARARGDAATAEALYREALAVIHEVLPGTREEATTLNFLGNLMRDVGDAEAGEDYYRRALAIFEKIAPQGPPVAGMLNNLGNAAFVAGDLQAAEEYYRRALALREKLAPGSLDVAQSLSNLGEILRRDRLAEAEQHLRRAETIRRAKAPGSLALATTLAALGNTRLDQGRVKPARAAFEEALAIRSRLAPASGVEAESLHDLGRASRAAGRTREAIGFLERAVGMVEAYRGRVRSEIQGGFAARYGAIYHDLAQLKRAQGRTDEVFAILERQRARALLAMTAERDLVFGDVPPDLDRERRQLDREYDQALERLGREGAKSAERAAELARALAALRGRREQLVYRLRQASPALAALQYPQPLDLRQAAAALDPGTVLLAYSVGEARTLLVAVAATAPGRPVPHAVFSLPVGSGQLRERVTAFRALIEGSGRGAPGDDALEAQGAALFARLLAPAASFLARAQRLVIVPDGPLHTLPFAALVVSRRPPRFLAQTAPLSIALSATLLAEARRRERAPPQPPVLVAFGDPELRAATADARRGGAGLLAVAAAGGRELGRLPFTRDEVQRIGGVFGAEAVTLLGPAATEERARSVPRHTRYVHFASHAVLDRHRPLESALMLSSPLPPDHGENGLLQAWEVFERVRLDADLVTLSACETGLGRDMGAEGLIGLSRAFQYAGARAVMASLWAVSDRSTPALMESFYRHLKNGRRKDEALQAAQREMIDAGARPFHWAAFQITGDAR